MYTVNELVEHCNYDIGDMSSECVYACYNSRYEDTVYCISEVCIADISPTYHVVVIRIIDDFIDTFNVKCFKKFEEAKFLLDMMTYTDYVVLLNNNDDNYEEGTDKDFDTHFVDVQNGNGYYDEDGKYRSYGCSDEYF